MAALASAQELATLLGVDLPEEDSADRARMELLLDLASDWARELAGRVWADPAAVPATVRGIVLASARREWNNPKRVVYEVKGPESTTYDRKAYPPGFFTEAEERYLQRFRSSGALWTQSTFRDFDEESIGYLKISGVGGYLPYYHPNDPGYEESFKL